MRVGVFTPLLSKLPLDAVLKKLAELDIHTVELATGNYVGDAHCKLSMLENSAPLNDFKKLLNDHGVGISALSCHGNALHPDKSLAQAHRETSRKTILLAEKLGVPVMVDFSGCPGDSLRMPLLPTGSRAHGLRTFARCSSGSGTKWSRPIGRSTPSSQPTTE